MKIGNSAQNIHVIYCFNIRIEIFDYIHTEEDWCHFLIYIVRFLSCLSIVLIFSWQVIVSVFVLVILVLIFDIAVTLGLSSEINHYIIG